jgi:hypothetical protein
VDAIFSTKSTVPTPSWHRIGTGALFERPPQHSIGKLRRLLIIAAEKMRIAVQRDRWSSMSRTSRDDMHRNTGPEKMRDMRVSQSVEPGAMSLSGNFAATCCWLSAASL